MSSGAQGFTFSLNSGTVLQHWKPNLVRSLSTQIRMSFNQQKYIFFINFECDLTIVLFNDKEFNLNTILGLRIHGRYKLKSVFSWRHGGHIGVPKQQIGGHIGAPNQSAGNWMLFLCKHRKPILSVEWKRSITKAPEDFLSRCLKL